MLPKPRSIKDEGGLKAHLDERYELFCQLDDSQVSNAAMARVFYVGRDTIRRWKKIRKQEGK